MFTTELVSAMESYKKAQSELRAACIDAVFGTAVVGCWYLRRDDESTYFFPTIILACPLEGGESSYKFAGYNVVLSGESVTISPVTSIVSDRDDFCDQYMCAGYEEALVSVVKPMFESLALSWGGVVRAE